MKVKYPIFVLLFLMLVLAGVFAFLLWQNNQKETSDKKTEAVSYLSRDSIFYIIKAAEDRGYFKEKEISIEYIKPFESEGAAENWDNNNDFFLEYLAQQNPDLTAVSLDNLFDLENKYPGKYKAIAFLSETSSSYMTNIITSKNSSINDFSDLSGKTIAIGTNKIDDFLVSEYSRKMGLGEIKTIKLPYSQIDDYLEQGKVDAAFVQEPKASQLVSSNKAKIIVKNPTNFIGSDFENFPIEAVIIRADFIKENKNTADSLIEIFNNLSKLSNNDFRKALENSLDDSWADTISARTFPYIELYSTVKLEKISKIADALLEGGYLNKIPNINGLIYGK